MSPAIAAASAPRGARALRVLVAEGERPRVVRAPELATVLSQGDLVVLNDAATLPAVVRARTAAGEPVEFRLASAPDEAGEADAVLFGAGDHRTPTELRPAPPALSVFDRAFAGPLVVEVLGVHRLSPRLVRVRLSAARPVAHEDARAAAVSALFRVGRPVQYAHAPGPLALWDVWNAWAGPPWAVEMPSAGRALDAAVLASLRVRGVAVATITHAAGLSSTGDPSIDAALPLPERSRVPAETVAAIARARAAGGRVLAVGTSVVRALETAGGAPFDGVTDLRIGPATRLRSSDGILTGIHEPGTSHHELLRAFASEERLEIMLARSAELGLLGHELGDAWLLWSRGSST